MKKLICILFVILILLPNTLALANNPYPPPLPTPNPTPRPNTPSADCPPTDKPCVWGMFYDGRHWRWWVTYPGLDLGITDGFILVYGSGGASMSLPLRVHGYNGTEDVSWYKSGSFDNYCGGSFFSGGAYLGGQWADIRQPNIYYLFCIRLPLLRNG